MRKKLNIFLRIGITAILILVQIALFSLLLIYFVHWGPIVTVAMYFFSLLVLLFIIRNDDEAGYKIGWIIVVFFCLLRVDCFTSCLGAIAQPESCTTPSTGNIRQTASS